MNEEPKAFDARGNGGGGIIPTMTGDHENRITDYTTIVCYSVNGYADYIEDFPTIRASGGDTGGGGEGLVVIALEGNGTRPSHKGSGICEQGKMFTLNTIENHAVCYGEDLYN